MILLFFSGVPSRTNCIPALTSPPVLIALAMRTTPLSTRRGEGVKPICGKQICLRESVVR
jgi:hypothetical protein